MSLRTDYKDDIMKDLGGKRKYRMTNNSDGTVSFDDVTEYQQLGDLYGAGDINKTNQAVNECFQSVSDGKRKVASAITDKKVPTDATATFDEMAANIRKIVLGSGNAVAADVLQGKTFTNDDGVEYTGTMKDNGAYIATLTGNDVVYWANQNQDLNSNIPNGRHNGSRVFIAAAELQKIKNTFIDYVKKNPGAYGITVAATSQNGEFVTGWIKDNHTISDTISFSKTFEKAPNVLVAAREGNWTLRVTGVTAGGFTVSITSHNYGETQCTVVWNATA